MTVYVPAKPGEARGGIRFGWTKAQVFEVKSPFRRWLNLVRTYPGCELIGGQHGIDLLRYPVQRTQRGPAAPVPNRQGKEEYQAGEGEPSARSTRA